MADIQLVKLLGVNTVTIKGDKGEKGDNAVSDKVQIPFSWGDAPQKIFTSLAGKLIYSIIVIITVAFNGTNPAITIGDDGDNDRLFGTVDIDPSIPATWEVYPNYAYGSDTDVNIYIIPGAGASSGAGRVIITIQP